jgi:hypothetical protein
MPLRVIIKDSGPRLRVVGLPLGLPKMAYVNSVGSEQAAVTITGHTSTTAYDKNGQTIPYDASKFYTVTERCALGVWQPNNDMFSLVQNVDNNNLEIQNNMSDARTLSVVKYETEDNPTIEIWYTQPGGDLANTYYFYNNYISMSRAPARYANGNYVDYSYFNDKEVVAWHNGTEWVPNPSTKNFTITNYNGTAYATNNGPSCYCSAVMTIKKAT